MALRTCCVIFLSCLSTNFSLINAQEEQPEEPVSNFDGLTYDRKYMDTLTDDHVWGKKE